MTVLLDMPGKINSGWDVKNLKHPFHFSHFLNTSEFQQVHSSNPLSFLPIPRIFCCKGIPQYGYRGL